eukprot:1159999-Pelagomonas_calceolata.AAC.2
MYAARACKHTVNLEKSISHGSLFLAGPTAGSNDWPPVLDGNDRPPVLDGILLQGKAALKWFIGPWEGMQASS